MTTTTGMEQPFATLFHACSFPLTMKKNTTYKNKLLFM